MKMEGRTHEVLQEVDLLISKRQVNKKRTGIHECDE